MRVSTKGRYALRLMLDLAQHQADAYVPLKEVAQRQGISKNYLDQIMMMLNHARFFKITRGKQGGYRLARDPSTYSVGDILRATEGSIAPVACLEDCGAGCERSVDCMAMQVWAGLEQATGNYLDNLSLQDILDKYGKPAKS